MEHAIHIIHPYTYRLQKDTLQIGPMEEYATRDQQVADFVGVALERAQVFLHLRDSPMTLAGMLAMTAFLESPLDRIFSDERMVSIVTSPQGLPIPDGRPQNIPEDIWKDVQRLYTSHTALKEKMKKRDVSFFIGGALENCVASFALYHHEHYRKDGEQLFYIPELCASFDAEQWRKSEKLLHERNINPLSFKEALEAIRKGGQRT